MVELFSEDIWMATKTALDESITGDSNLEQAFSALGIKRLPKGTVLDIGSGTRGAFQFEAKAQFPDTRVISVSPNLINEKYMRRQPEMEEYYQLSKTHKFLGAAAVAQMLPFADNSFEMVISHRAVPLFLPSNEVQYKAVFSETLRVLKRKGVAVFAPMQLDQTLNASSALVNIGFNENSIKKEVTTPQSPIIEKLSEISYRLGFQK